MALGPFSDFEGRLDPVIRAQKLKNLQVWFEVGRILGTDIIQIPCTFMTEGVTGDLETVARDLREIADLGAKETPPYKFAYENLCWGTFNDTWEKAWAVVQAVDRVNFGMCLDTFNIAGREWADPASPTGKVENADEVFRESLRRMVRTIDVKRVFYVQVVDAERLSAPLDESHPFHVAGQKPRMSWSRNSRLFICEAQRGGYLPVFEVLKAICDKEEGLGYEGWISMELFNRSLLDERDEVPKEHAERAMKSWRRLVNTMGWQDKVESRRVEGQSEVHVEAAHGTEIFARL
jgi:4-hydroxyphenylpyruvate dioxygenase